MLFEAAEEVCDPSSYEEEWSAPRPKCREVTQWDDIIDMLASHVLWDADYDMEEFFMDASPELAEFQRQRMGIADDYFTDIPPDPTPEQMKKVRAGLRRLLRC